MADGSGGHGDTGADKLRRDFCFCHCIVSEKRKGREAGADGSGSRFLHAGIYRKQYVQLSADNERHDHVYDFGNGGGNRKKQARLKNPPVPVEREQGAGFKDRSVVQRI